MDHLYSRTLLITGTLAVLGALMRRSTYANPAVDLALKQAPRPGSDEKVLIDPINPMDLLPRADPRGRRPSVHYLGSLTTPPCSEKVDWFVFKDPVLVSDGQVRDALWHPWQCLNCAHHMVDVLSHDLSYQRCAICLIRSIST